MITIACTNCKTLLTMDEAFAGGVCRCQHCGTIQTVPSHLKQGSAAGAPAGRAVGASKSLYQQTRTPTDAASGLEALGDAVTSSGLGSARLKSPRVAPGSGKSIDRPAEAPPIKNPLLIPLLVAVGAIVVLGIAFAIYMMTRSPSPGGSTPGSSTNTTNTPGAVPAAQSPSFLGYPIKGANVIYLIDRGNSSSDYFDGIKVALLKSLHSLGPDHSFQVMLWDNDQAAVVLPATGMWDATDQYIRQVDEALRDVGASGYSTVKVQLKNAISHRPDAIVIATAKVIMDDDDLKALKAAQSAGIPLYLFDIGNIDLTQPFLAAASASHGSFYTVTKDQLDQASQ